MDENNRDKNSKGDKGKQRYFLEKKSNGKNSYRKKISKNYDLDLRSKLQYSLCKENNECMICLNRIKIIDEIWDCKICWVIFHLKCVKKWAKACQDVWRCPGCQNTTDVLPSSYLCFCGKKENPKPDSFFPHSCGNVCKRMGTKCNHECTILCHPGPCPPCDVFIIRQCFCRKVDYSFKCSTEITSDMLCCNEKCGKIKKCGFHTCEKNCHEGECDFCEIEVPSVCFCSKMISYSSCTPTPFSCGKMCGKTFENCANKSEHYCQLRCHDDGECRHDSCPFSFKSCYCGKVFDDRNSCAEPIKVCNQICGKPILMKCGHEKTCGLKCHSGKCEPQIPDCKEMLKPISCACGSEIKNFTCSEFSLMNHTFNCTRVCHKLRNCGKHRCNTTCCPLANFPHECPLVCNKRLGCKIHTCNRLCHKGTCPPCLEASFDEWSCSCGKTKVYPPIKCGQTLPECSFPCLIQRECGHQETGYIHNCHDRTIPCPPCVFLTTKHCICGKSLVKNAPCYKSLVQCTVPCGKLLECGIHNCKRVCHVDPCNPKQIKCFEKCGVILQCLHPCEKLCHAAESNNHSECVFPVHSMCECKNIQKIIMCKDKFIPCDDTCASALRSKMLADALQISNAQKKLKLSKFIIDFSKQNPKFLMSVEENLNNFIVMPHENNVLRFPPMNETRRQFVFSLIEQTYFGLSCTSADWGNNRSLEVSKSQTCRIPSSLVSRAIFSGNFEEFENITSSCSLNHAHHLSSCPPYFETMIKIFSCKFGEFWQLPNVNCLIMENWPTYEYEQELVVSTLSNGITLIKNELNLLIEDSCTCTCNGCIVFPSWDTYISCTPLSPPLYRSTAYLTREECQKFLNILESSSIILENFESFNIAFISDVDDISPLIINWLYFMICGILRNNLKLEVDFDNSKLDLIKISQRKRNEIIETNFNNSSLCPLNTKAVDVGFRKNSKIIRLDFSTVSKCNSNNIFSAKVDILNDNVEKETMEISSSSYEILESMENNN